MTTFLTIYLLVLTFVLLNGLFNKEWHSEAQWIVDSIINKATFWYLIRVKDEYGYTVPSIYIMYLTKSATNALEFEFAKARDKYLYDHHISTAIVKKRRNAFKNIQILQKEIVLRDKEITQILAPHHFSRIDIGLSNAFDEFEEEHIVLIDPQCERVFRMFTTTEGSQKGTDLWVDRKNISDSIEDLKWKPSGNERAENFENFEFAHMQAGYVFRKYLCGEIQNQSESERLKILIQEWEQLKMLQSCIGDFTAWIINRNRLNIAFWRIVRVFIAR